MDRDVVDLGGMAAERDLGGRPETDEIRPERIARAVDAAMRKRHP